MGLAQTKAQQATVAGIPGVLLSAVNSIRITPTTVIMCVNPKCLAERAMPRPDPITAINKKGEVYQKRFIPPKFSTEDAEVLSMSYHNNLGNKAIGRVRTNMIDGVPNIQSSKVCI